MRRILPLALLLIACGGAAAPIPEPTPMGARVPRVGDDWPFAFAGGWVSCTTEARTGDPWVYLDADDGNTYALNGAARDQGWNDALDELLPGRVPMDVQPYIDLGLGRC